MTTHKTAVITLHEGQWAVGEDAVCVCGWHEKWTEKEDALASARLHKKQMTIWKSGADRNDLYRSAYQGIMFGTTGSIPSSYSGITTDDAIDLSYEFLEDIYSDMQSGDIPSTQSVWELFMEAWTFISYVRQYRVNDERHKMKAIAKVANFLRVTESLFKELR